MPSLFDPLHLGSLVIPNRILMAPLTRGRATQDHVPTPLMGTYYRQRASAGLIISEATGISREGLGWPFAPGLWNDAQVQAWTPITDAVHAAGGHIYAQLWHMGRVVHPSYLGGAKSVSASATTAPGDAHTYAGKQPHAEARALDEAEVPRLLQDYRNAAANALRAGFDGVQLHAANGYLIDQFLRDSSNLRTDRYGGPIENRIRLLDEVTRAIAETVGAGRTAVRLSPNGNVQGVDDSNPHALFTAAATALSRIGIAFLEIREPQGNSTYRPAEVPLIAPAIRAAFDGPLVLNSDFVTENAMQAVAQGHADAIAFGRPFIANPDLPRRIAEGLPLAEAQVATYYSRGGEGYVDYPYVGEA